jgi:hypothetical protein
MIALLLGLNGLLGLAFLAALAKPAPVLAQTAGRPGDFLCVTAKAAGQTYDVVYVLDVPARKLHALYPANAQTRQLLYAQSRDLDKDFRRK